MSQQPPPAPSPATSPEGGVTLWRRISEVAIHGPGEMLLAALPLPPLARTILRPMLTALWMALRIYVLLVVILWFIQDSLLYFPRRFSPDEAEQLLKNNHLTPYVPASAPGKARDDLRNAAAGFNDIAYTTSDAPDPHAPGTRGTIIVAHGNGGTALMSAGFAEALQPLGFRVILYEYPGYGTNPGTPSERANVEPLRSLVRAAAAEHAAAGRGGVYLFGQSLGCGVVCSALSDTTLPVAGVILLQPWDSLGGVAAVQYPFLPARLMTWGKYNTIKHLPAFLDASADRSASPPASRVPVAIITCADDTTIPPHLSRRVYDAIPEPKLWLQFPNANHNTWPHDAHEPWWKQVTDFVAPPAKAPATP
ncbi:hypothetical protein DB346_07535 [Verrucomicrobia bacterium LW23]|nr:hypothetical protein DB346_07535 [Verrucomicrobia bacterium LW23]